MSGQSIRLASLALAMAFAGASLAALTPYSQDFEGLNAGSSSALADDGWLIFANVFDGGGTRVYFYGPFPAPNPGGGFSGIASGEGGPAQGQQYLNTYSDYNNGDHNNGLTIEANVFQERTIGAADLGKAFEFRFDYKASSQFGPAGLTNTKAFIKVLDPSNGFAMVAFPNLDTTAASTSTWASGMLGVTIDAAWTGHILQFGFMNTATRYQPSGVYYDNIDAQAVPEPATLTILGASVLAAALRRRRK